MKMQAVPISSVNILCQDQDGLSEITVSLYKLLVKF